MSISPLRQRMIEDMAARHFGEKAQKDYIRCVKNLTVFLGRPPETAEIEDLRRFRLHLIESSLSVSSVNTAMQALRFFFSVTLDKPGLLKALFRVQGPQKLPTVLTQEEVARLLNSASSAKHKAALSVAYGAGLRASEVVSLKVSDIDSARMVLRVEQGKGRKDRHAMLSPMRKLPSDLLVATSLPWGEFAPRLPALHRCALSGRRRLKSGKKLGLFGNTAISKHLNIYLEYLD